VQLQRLTRCTDDGGVAASAAWEKARRGADGVNAALYRFANDTTHAGFNHTRLLGYKCNPGEARADGTYGGATISCPPLIASIDAFNDTSVLVRHTVPADASFGQSYLQYRCPIDNLSACGAVGQMPVSAYEALSTVDNTTRALVALLPTVERMTRCADVRELLEEAQSTHCVRARTAVHLVFAVRSSRFIHAHAACACACFSCLFSRTHPAAVADERVRAPRLLRAQGFMAACVSFVVLFFLLMYGSSTFHPEDALFSLCGCCAKPRAAHDAPAKEAHPEQEDEAEEQLEEAQQEEAAEEWEAADEEQAVSAPLRHDEEEAREERLPALTKPSQQSRGAALARLAEDDEIRAVETNGSAKSAVVVPVASGWKSSGR
jgi:hypothetical protein